MKQMNQNKVSMAGWLVAAVLGGVVLTGGFQGAQDKFGVVDVNKAVVDSEMGKKNREKMDAESVARQGIIDFMQTHRVLTVEQAQKIKTLSLKTPLSATEKAELDKVKEEVVKAAKSFDTLNQKPSPTDDDRNLLQEYNNRVQNTGALVQEWGQTFYNDLANLKETLIQDAVKKADTSIKELSKKDGYTLVFSSPGACVYGANDLTDAVTKSLNASK